MKKSMKSGMKAALGKGLPAARTKNPADKKKSGAMQGGKMAGVKSTTKNGKYC